MTEKQLPAAPLELGDGFVPRTIAEVEAMSRICAESGYFDGINKPAQAMIKILKGAELGMSPMEAMESVYITKGKTGIEAKNIAARIQSSNKYKYKVIEWTEERCVLRFFENGEPLEGDVEFTLDEACKAGWTQNKQYQFNRKNMLFYRAITRGQKVHCPDLYRIPVYSKEELDDMVVAEKVTVETTAKADAEAMLKAAKERKAKKKDEKPEPVQDTVDVEVEPVRAETEEQVETSQAPEQSTVQAAQVSALSADDELITPETWGRLIQTGQANRWNSLDLERLCERKYGLPEGDGKAITNKQARNVAAIISKVTPEAAGLR